MSYPNQISSTPKTTAKGTKYHEVEVHPFGVPDMMLMLVPDSVAAGARVVVVICAHGSGGTEQTVNSENMAASRDALLDRGYVVLSAFAHDRAWSNDDALDDYERVYLYAAQQWSISDVLFHGQSMGGLTLAVLYAQRRVPNVRAVAIVDGAVSLAAAFEHPAHRGHIRAAYGINGSGSDYAVKTAGHDACLRPVGDFTESRVYLWASYEDTSTPRAQHADPFWDRYHRYAVEMTLQGGTGPHLDPTHYQPRVLMDFYDRAMGVRPTLIHHIQKRYRVGADRRLYELRPATS